MEGFEEHTLENMLSQEELKAQIAALELNLERLKSELEGERGAELEKNLETEGSPLREAYERILPDIKIVLKVLAEVGKTALAAGAVGGAVYAATAPFELPHDSSMLRELSIAFSAAWGSIWWIGHKLDLDQVPKHKKHKSASHKNKTD